MFSNILYFGEYFATIMLTADYKQIGKGTYGTVYKSNDTNKVIKKMKKKEFNLTEIIFLRSLCNEYSFEFIPRIYDIEIATDFIYYMMDDCGITLNKYGHRILYAQKIKLLPSILSQIARFLIWMKNHNLVHMDIKPDNICIREVGDGVIIKFIDFGFAGVRSEYSECYYGTVNFADPKYLTKKKKISYEYDMFSCGHTLSQFLLRRYSMPDDHYYSNSFPNMYKKMEKNNVSLYGDIIYRMVDLDEKTRITPEELYNTLSIKLPLEGAVAKAIVAKATVAVAKAETSTILNKIKLLCKNIKIEYLYNYTAYIFRNVVSNVVSNVGGDNITVESANECEVNNYEYAIACLFIANYIIHGSSRFIKLANVKKIKHTEYSYIDFFTLSINICSSLNWQIYFSNEVIAATKVVTKAITGAITKAITGAITKAAATEAITEVATATKAVTKAATEAITKAVTKVTTTEAITGAVTKAATEVAIAEAVTKAATEVAIAEAAAAATNNIISLSKIIDEMAIEIRNKNGKCILLTIDKKIVWNTFQSFPEFWDLFTTKKDGKQIATKQKYSIGFNTIRSLHN